jgi:hypothetical protein
VIVTRDWLLLFEVCVDKLLIEGTFSRADISFSLLIFDFFFRGDGCVCWLVACASFFWSFDLLRRCVFQQT